MLARVEAADRGRLVLPVVLAADRPPDLDGDLELAALLANRPVHHRAGGGGLPVVAATSGGDQSGRERRNRGSEKPPSHVRSLPDPRAFLSMREEGHHRAPRIMSA